MPSSIAWEPLGYSSESEARAAYGSTEGDTSERTTIHRIHELSWHAVEKSSYLRMENNQTLLPLSIDHSSPFVQIITYVLRFGIRNLVDYKTNGPIHDYSNLTHVSPRKQRSRDLKLPKITYENDIATFPHCTVH